MVPLLPEKDYKFRPTTEDVATAHKLFVPGHKHDIHFLKSALLDEQLPDYDLPEVRMVYFTRALCRFSRYNYLGVFRLISSICGGRQMLLWAVFQTRPGANVDTSTVNKHR